MVQATLITSDLGPCSVGPADKDAPTIDGYATLAEALERHEGRLRGTADELDPGFSLRFYLFVHGALRPVGRLTLEREGRRVRTVWSYEPGFDGPLGMPNDDLIAQARQGSPMAAAELDRRCVLPPLIEPDAPAIPRDALREFGIGLRPGVLREFAGALKHESAMIESAAGSVVQRIVVRPHDADDDMLLWTRTMYASIVLESAAVALVEMANAIDRGTGLPVAMDVQRAAAEGDLHGATDR